MSNAPYDDLHPDSVAVAAGRPTGVGQPVNWPVTPASNFISDPQAVAGGREYSRGDGTSTVEGLESAIGALEGGHAVAFASGMGAISAVLGPLPPGARILAPDDLYQGAATVLADGAERLGWKVKRLPTAATGAWLEAIPGADLVWIESPSNPMLEIADVPALCAAAQAGNVPAVVDNTFATPLLQRPLDLGASLVVHSATKFIGGHSDLLAGIVVAKSADLQQTVQRQRTYGGATPGALEAYLALRGLRTLPLRLERSQANALVIAERLAQHRLVSRVHYPGLVTDPGYDLMRSTMQGPGAVLSFELAGSDTSTDVRLSRLRLITTATSLGGVESTIERRAKLMGQEHIAPTLCRLSVGIEHVEDLWRDLLQCLDGLT
ncbi:MAG: cystathionine gamma-synthase [Acidimicrobiales bacterium]